MKVFKKINSFLHLSTMDIKEVIKSAFQDDFGEKDVELIVNGLAKKLTPELQSILVFSLIKYRNREIEETEAKLTLLKENKNQLERAILIANKQT